MWQLVWRLKVWSSSGRCNPPPNYFHPFVSRSWLANSFQSQPSSSFSTSEPPPALVIVCSEPPCSILLLCRQRTVLTGSIALPQNWVCKVVTKDKDLRAHLQSIHTKSSFCFLVEWLCAPRVQERLQIWVRWTCDRVLQSLSVRRT